MAISKIQYDDKVAINIDSTIPDINKCNASDLNEIKSVVNNNADEIPSNDNLVNVGSSVDTDYKVNVLTTKNLLNPNNKLDNCAFDNTNNVIIASTSYELYIIPIKEGKTYVSSATLGTSSGNIAYAYCNSTPQLNTSIVGRTTTDISILNNGTFTAPSNVKYLLIRITKASQSLSNWQLEEGSTPTTYEAFIPNTINVNNEKYTDTINVGTSINDKNRVNVLYSRNLLPYPYTDTTKTINGITFTDNGDGTITISGTANANASFKLLGDDSHQYNIEGNYINGGTSAITRVQVVHYNPGYTVLANSTGSEVEINKSTYTTGYIEIVVSSGTSITTPITIKPIMTKTSYFGEWNKYVGSPSINVDGEEIYNANIGKYSTNEINTGMKWIDGKPIYRVVYQGINPNSEVSDWTQLFAIANLSSIVNIYGNFDGINKNPIPRYESNSYRFLLAVAGTTISYRQAGYNNINFHLVVEYTKTTD